MAVIVFTGGQANAAGGGDIALAALDWANISVTNGSGVEASATKTLADISSPVVLRFEWTSTSGSPTKAQIIKNGGAVQSPTLSAIEATCSVGDMIFWQTYAAYTHPAGNYDSGTVTVTNRTQSGVFTVTVASPGVFTKTGHQLAADMKVRLSTTGALPTGLTAGNTYFVISSGLGANDFQLSATQGGAAINTSGVQSGTHTLEVVVDTFTYACQYIRTGGGGGGYLEPPDIEAP